MSRDAGTFPVDYAYPETLEPTQWIARFMRRCQRRLFRRLVRVCLVRAMGVAAMCRNYLAPQPEPANAIEVSRGPCVRRHW